MSTEIRLDVSLEADVIFYISDDAPADIFTRAEAQEFQDHLYGKDVSDRATVLSHWAYNAILNGVSSASSLDGWGDLDRDDVRFVVGYGSVDGVREMEQTS